MGRVGVRVSGSCFGVTRVRSPRLQSKPGYDSMKCASQKSECYENDTGLSFSSTDTRGSSDVSSTQSESKMCNRIMVVVDSSHESKGALQWALSHTVQNEDTVVLLHIARPSKSGSCTDAGVNPGVSGLLSSMKSICEAKKPGVQVEGVALTGKEKGPVIVDQAKKQKVTLLVLGHRRRPIAWRLLHRWFGRKRSSQSIVDYCIQNADCMTVAVRRKSRRLGGYLITTKRHKNFWLLA